MNGRLSIAVILLIVFAAWFMDSLAHTEMTKAAKLIIGGVTITVILSLIFYFLAFIREDDAGAVWRPLHLNAGHYQNGKPIEPSGIEVALYKLWHSRPAIAAPDSPLLIEAQAIPELLPILDSAQRVLIIGASGSGKTNVLQWVVSRRGGGVLVIDPHAAPGKWTGRKLSALAQTSLRLKPPLIT